MAKPNFFVQYKYELVVFIPLTIALLILSFYILYPVSPTPDPAIHSEIVKLIQYQGYVQSWEPYAKNDFTYPPFFHYLAYLFSLLDLSALEWVRVLGIITFLTFPLAVYLLLKTWRKDIAVLGAVTLVLIPGFANVFMMGEFPQLLAMEFIILLLYFLRKGKYLLASVLTGLTVITHPFMAIIAVVIHLLYFKEVISQPNRIKILYFLIPLIVVSFWLPQYWQIFTNAVSGQWQNVQYNYPPWSQPVFWFWHPDQIWDFLFGFGFLTPVIIPLSLFGMIKTKGPLKIIYLLCMLFTIYHLPGTQLKVLDLFTIPAGVLAVAGLKDLAKYFKGYQIVPIVIFILFMGWFQVTHFVIAKTYWGNPNVPPESLIDASLYLRGYDKGPGRIYVDRASAWVGILANKIPLDSDIPHIEHFSAEYREQLEARETIKEYLENGNNRLENLLKEWKIRYVITEKTANLKPIYSNGWNVYEV